MPKTDVAYQARALLVRFPLSVQRELVEDDAFRSRLELAGGGTLTLGDDEVTFDSARFADAVGALHDGGGDGVLLADQAGRTWTLTTERADEGSVLRLSDGATLHRILETPGLKASSAERIDDLDRAARRAALLPQNVEVWRRAMLARKLDDTEIAALDHALSSTPVAVGRRAGDVMMGNFSIEALVPSDHAYWDYLCGPGEVTTIADVAQQTKRYAEDLLINLGSEGAKHAFLLASHSSLLEGSAIASQPTAELVELVTWAAASGDLVAKAAAVEVGLGALPRAPELIEPLSIIVDDFFALNPKSAESALHLFTALYVLVDGQLSNLKLLENWPPLRRRQAAIAHASLLARHWPKPRKIKPFLKWAMEARGLDFHFQTLIDQRLEPRWNSNYASPAQWKNELIGRLQNAVTRHADAIKGTPLSDRLLGKGKASLQRQLVFPGSFLPGPLEGAAPAAPPLMPEEMAQIVEGCLNVEVLELKSLASLINISGLFSVDDDKIGRALALIEKAGHRLPESVDADTAQGLFAGLARLAAIARSVPLADELRVMIRRRRIDGEATSARQLIELALTAGAAHAEKKDWANAIGDWIAEIAFETTDAEFASALVGDLETVCVAEPFLRLKLGRSITALESFLAS